MASVGRACGVSDGGGRKSFVSTALAAAIVPVAGIGLSDPIGLAPAGTLDSKADAARPISVAKDRKLSNPVSHARD